MPNKNPKKYEVNRKLGGEKPHRLNEYDENFATNTNKGAFSIY